MAIALIAERGWAATTMASIAEAAGVSEPTLFRYFPSKADVLWFGMADNVVLWRTAFERRKDADSPAGAIVSAYLDMLRNDSARLALVKARLAIIAVDDRAAEASWPAFRQWSALTTELVAAGGRTANDAPIVGAMVWGALWASMQRWAQSDATDPGSHLEDARRLIAAVLRES